MTSSLVMQRFWVYDVTLRLLQLSLLGIGRTATYLLRVLIGDGDGFSEPRTRIKVQGSGSGSRKGCWQATPQESWF